MKIYPLGEKAEKEYNGCGKAWAAICNKEVVAIRYMSFAIDPSEAPAWVKAVLNAYCSICEPWCNINFISPTDLGKIKKAAINAGHPEYGPRGGHIKASVIARDALKILREIEKKQFGKFRERNKTELAKMGNVVSGMCSSREFIAK